MSLERAIRLMAERETQEERHYPVDVKLWGHFTGVELLKDCLPCYRANPGLENMNLGPVGKHFLCFASIQTTREAATRLHRLAPEYDVIFLAQDTENHALWGSIPTFTIFDIIAELRRLAHRHGETLWD